MEVEEGVGRDKVSERGEKMGGGMVVYSKDVHIIYITAFYRKKKKLRNTSLGLAQ